MHPRTCGACGGAVEASSSPVPFEVRGETIVVDGISHGAGRPRENCNVAGLERGKRLWPDMAGNHGLGTELHNVSARLDAGTLGRLQVHLIVNDFGYASVRIMNHKLFGPAKARVKQRAGAWHRALPGRAPTGLSRWREPRSVITCRWS